MDKWMDRLHRITKRQRGVVMCILLARHHSTSHAVALAVQVTAAVPDREPLQGCGDPCTASRTAHDGGGGGGLAERSASKHTQRQVSGVKAPPDMAALPAGLADGGGGTAGVPWDVVEPNVDDPMPYAWDQPDGQHAVMVAAFVAGTAPAPDNAHVSDPCQYSLRCKHFSHLLLYTSIQTVSCKHWRALHTITCP